jgi:membrane-bound lytic murein transglycosylase MltF
VLNTDEAFNLLSKDEVDIVMSGLVYEEQRESVFDASITYLSVNYYLHEKA